MFLHFSSRIIVLKPGPTRRVDPGLEPGRVEEKTREGNSGVTRWSSWPDKIKSKIRLEPVDFYLYFLLKQYYFDFFKKIIDLNNPVQDLRTRVYKLRVELSFQRDSFVIFVLCRNLGMIPSPWENSAHHWKSPSNEAFVLLWGWHPPAHPILFLCLCWETKRGAKPNGPNSMPFVLVVWYYIPPSSPFYLCSCPKQSGI
jgi:hypothetical protein